MIRQNPPDPPIIPTPGPQATEWRWDGRKEEILNIWFVHDHVEQPDPTVAWRYRIDYFHQFDHGRQLTYASNTPAGFILAQEPPTPGQYTLRFVQLETYSERHNRACGAKIEYTQTWYSDGSSKISLSGKVIDPARWEPRHRFGPMLQGPAAYLVWAITKTDDGPWTDYKTGYPAWAILPMNEAKSKAIAWYNEQRAAAEANPGSPIPFGDRNAEHALHHSTEREWPLPETWPGKNRLVPWRVWVRWRKDYSTLMTDEGMSPWRVSIEMLDPNPELALWEFKAMSPIVRHVIMEVVTEDE